MSTWTPARKKERCFNLFLFVSKEDEENAIVTEIGVTEHWLAGDDRLKLAFLERSVKEDCHTSKRFKIPKRFIVLLPSFMREGCMTCDMIHEQRNGVALEWLYREIDAPQSPLMVVTAIVDGQVRIDQSTRFDDAPIGSQP